MNHQPASVDIQERMEQMVSTLSVHNIRIIPQGPAALNAFAVSDGHPSLEMLCEAVRHQFPTASISIIYKTAHLLKQLNEMREIAFPEGGKRYDGNTPYPHSHVIRIKGKRIADRNVDNRVEMKHR